MPWLISRFPELQHLEPSQRAQLLGQLPWWTYPQIVIRSLLVALCIVGLIGGFILQGLDWDKRLILSGIIELVFAVIFYRQQLKVFRSFVRLEIAKAFEGQRPPFCFGCGYDLRGSTQSACPECGKPIEPGPTTVTTD